MVWQDPKRYAAAKLLVPSEAFSLSSAHWTVNVIDLIYSARAVIVVDEATAPLKQLGASVIRSAQCCRQRYAQVTVEDEATAPLKHVLVGFEREDPEVTMALEPMAALKHGALELITQDHRAVTHGAKSWHH